MTVKELEAAFTAAAPCKIRFVCSIIETDFAVQSMSISNET